MNYDAAVFKATNTAGIGIVVRNWHGAALAALSMPAPLSMSVANLEALACCQAVIFAADLGLHTIIFEGDVASVINAISKGKDVLTSYGNLVDDIHSLVFVFQSAQFVYVVADALVKKSKNLLGLQVWLDNMPEDISQLISFDVP